MPIVSHSVIEDSVQADGERYVRYAFVFHTGERVVTSPKRIPATADVEADAAAEVPLQEAAMIAEELLHIEEAMTAGLDPLREPDGSERNPNHVGRIPAVAEMFRRLLKNPNPVQTMRAAWLADRFTDNEIRAIMGTDQHTVDLIRAAVEDGKTIATIIDGYTPPLTGA